MIRARFTISVNELPRLPDASAALRSRLLLIPFNVSFEGKEDVDLLDRLRDEIPAITNWALEGLQQLRLHGRLIQPKSGTEILDDFVRYSSPVQAFLDDCCIICPNGELPAQELQAAWKIWCEENGHEVGSMSTFGTRLRAAIPRIKRTKRRRDGKQEYYYQGLILNQEIRSRVQPY
jgi:putative DNA primase/helicase